MAEGADEIRNALASAGAVADELAAALDRQEAAMLAWNADPDNEELMSAAEAATDAVRPLIARAQEWVDAPPLDRVGEDPS